MQKTPLHCLVIGASRGLGATFCRALADRGERVFAGCRSVADLGPGIEILNLDVTNEASIEAAAETLKTKTDRLDLIIYCAGLLHNPEGMFPERKLEHVNMADLQAGFAVNAFGAILCAKVFTRFFPRKARCVLANMSARVGSIGDNRLGGWYTYRASKAAQNMFTRNLSIELRRKAKEVICVSLHPGTCATDLSAPFQKGVPVEKLFSSERAVTQLLAVIDGLGHDDNGRYIAWDGSDIPF